MVRIVRDEGVPALFRGVEPNVARAVLMNASQLATCVAFRFGGVRVGAEELMRSVGTTCSSRR